MADKTDRSSGFSEHVAPTFDVQDSENVEISNPRSFIQAQLLTTDSLVTEEIRFLAARIRVFADERPLRCIGVASATAGEGKSTISLALASMLTQESEERVLLLEADLRKPSLEGYLGLRSSPGLSEALNGDTRPLDLRRVAPYGFTFLSAGLEPFKNPAVFRTRRMSALLKAMRSSFDWIIIDCPPLIPLADTILLQDLMDGVVLVVRARHSPRQTLLRAAARLKPGKIVGTVFNAVRDILPSGENYGYRKYGESYGGPARE